MDTDALEEFSDELPEDGLVVAGGRVDAVEDGAEDGFDGAAEPEGRVDVADAVVVAPMLVPTCVPVLSDPPVEPAVVSAETVVVAVLPPDVLSDVPP